MLINAPFSITQLLGHNYKLGNLSNPALLIHLHINYSNILVNYRNSIPNHQNTTFIKKGVFKLTYLPLFNNATLFKITAANCNPLQNILFFKMTYQNNLKTLTLFYNLGYKGKKLLFVAQSGILWKAASLLTISSYKGPQAIIALKLTYIITKRKLRAKRKNLKALFSKLNVYGIFYLAVPKSSRLLTYIRNISLLSIGLNNSNMFDLNIPVYNNWITFKFLYIYQIYEFYRLGIYNSQLYKLHTSIYKLQYLYSLIFFKKI